MALKIHIKDNGYKEWIIFDVSSLQTVTIDVDPIENKLMHNDIFEYNSETKKANVMHSTARSSCNVPGILILSNNKTFGSNGKKLLYKCIPDDKRLPILLVPYADKPTFSKKQKNKYVLFKYNEWIGKHPTGSLVNVLGDVDDLTNYYEYQLYCKSLNASIQGFQRATSLALKQRSKEEYKDDILQRFPNIEDRTNEEVFTIDTKASQDFDDAMSIKEIDTDTKKVSIYITNVYIWMEVLNLWESFSERIATIYLPDRKRPMLPTALSDCLCSLQQGQDRFTFVLDVYIKNNVEIINMEFKNALIRVYKNYTYDSPELIIDKNYIMMFNVLQELPKKYKYIGRVKRSTDVVTYLMILMNYHSAHDLFENKNGIYRSVLLTTDVSIPTDKGLPDDVIKYLKIWNSSTSSYGLYSDKMKMKHDVLDLESYVHITSPIRRLVDLINMVQMFENKNMFVISQNCKEFCEKWINKMEYINTTMRAIRRVQTDCTLLEMTHNNPEMLTETYDGYLFDGFIRNDGLWQYMVYIPKIKISSRVTSREPMDNYSRKKYENIFV